MTTKAKSGFTLIELLVVLAIAAVLCAVTVAGFNAFLGAEAVDKDVEAIVAVLREAREQTVSSEGASQYGVFISSTSTTLFSGDTYSPTASGNKRVYLSGRTTLSTSITASTTIFQRLTGQASRAGTITVTQKTNPSKTKVITVYATGLIERN